MTTGGLPEGLDDERPVETVPWPTLDPAALSGVAGEIVSLIARDTEADPAALLITLLAVFGATVDGPYLVVANEQHRAVLHPLIVGRTSGGAKGTSLNAVEAVRKRALPDFDANVAHGLSTGEGLIELVRDGTGVEDVGVLDKRALIVETEYRSVLARGRRETSTLGTILRQAWDCADLRTLTRKRSMLIATRPHIVVIGHVTPREFSAMLSDSDLAGGTVNRLLMTCSQRIRLNSRFGNLPENRLDAAAEKFLTAHEHARGRGEVKCADAFWARWDRVYAELSRDRPETWASEATARGVVQVLRLALVFCLLDAAEDIDEQHLAAALALWGYCEDSARWVFSTVGQEAERSRQELLAEYIRDGGPAGRTRTQISNEHYSGHKSRQQIDAELEPLVHAGTVIESRLQTSGRPALRYVHRLCEKSGEAKDAVQPVKRTAQNGKRPRRKAADPRNKHQDPSVISPRDDTLSPPSELDVPQAKTGVEQASTASPLISLPETQTTASPGRPVNKVSNIGEATSKPLCTGCASEPGGHGPRGLWCRTCVAEGKAF